MAITHVIPEGTTEPQDFQLKVNGGNLDGTDLVLGLVIKDRNGLDVTLAGAFDWLVQASGTVRVDLDAADLPQNLGPYRVRWSITDTASKIAFIPNSVSADSWQVVAVP